MLYVPRDSSFISIYFFVLNLNCWFSAFSNKFCYFWIFSHYTIIIKVKLSIIFCLCSEDVYLSLGISLPVLFETISEFFCCDFLWFFDIALLYYYLNLSSSIISCLVSGDINLSLGIFYHVIFGCIEWGFLSVFRNFCNFVGNFVTTNLILSFFLFLVLSASVADVLAWSRGFWLSLQLTFLLIFLPIFLPIFLVKDKNQ